ARTWQQQSFKNGARPGGIINLGDLDEVTFNKTVAAFRWQVEGRQNAGRHLLIAGQGTDGGTGAKGRSNSAVAYRCITMLANNLASVDLVVRTPSGDLAELHPLSQLWNAKPNASMPAQVL
ncbi:hypothetical protein, partial [Saccharothrix sp. ST-888]|uniref:hypothetical protein n=1 Tax=Saccharothrix sp. ST-888 TaxID=1427391 RepID=UPI0005EC64A0